ncbi:MAG TPA: phosphoglycerate dehydrogenase [Solirubrobacteraceae bacterium]|jgi:phosphoglycerate dehydrogenase-like enzyme
MTDAGTVVITYPGYDPDTAEIARTLRDAGFTIRYEPRVNERTPDEVAELMAGATAGIISTDPFDEAVFARCPELRVLARVGVGTDAIDLRAATDAGVAVTITPGANANTVADHTMALILACSRRLLENDRMMREGKWERGGALSGTDLTGSTVGIVGMGLIGRAVAKRLRGFDVDVIGSDLPNVSQDGIVRMPLGDVLKAADVITVHVPLLPSTRGLIGAGELANVRRGAILINTSRGGVVDEDALVAALADGRLSAAGLDVFAREPPAGSPLLMMPNVVVSPHIAGISVYSQQRMLAMAASSILDVIAGRHTPGLVNPDALERPDDARVRTP